MNKNWYFKQKNEEALKIAITSKEGEIIFNRLKEIFDAKQKDKTINFSDLDKQNWEGRMAFSFGYKAAISDLYSFIILDNN